MLADKKKKKKKKKTSIIERLWIEWQLLIPYHFQIRIEKVIHEEGVLRTVI